MAKLTLSNVTSILGNPTSAAATINANSDLIETALENTLSRDGTTPNTMSADIDLNNNDILNVKSLDTETLVLNGSPITTESDLSSFDFSNLAENPSPILSLMSFPHSVTDHTYRITGDDIFDLINTNFDTEADFVEKSIPAALLVVRTAGYTTKGDGGGHLKIRISTPSPAYAWHKQSADGAWWEVSEKKIRPQMLGALADSSTNDTVALQASLDYGVAKNVPVEVLGRYRAYARLTSTGSLTVYGFGRKHSRIEWHASSTSFGLKLSATAQDDYLGVQDIGFYTFGTTASADNGGTGIELDFSGQGANVYNIEHRGHVTGCYVGGANGSLANYFNKGIVVTQPKSVLVENNCCIGGFTSPDTVNTLTATSGIEFIGTTTSAVSAKVWKNSTLFWKKGIYSDKVEGIWVEGNDSQANYIPLHIENSDFIKNQVRVINNHLGGHHGSIILDAVQFFMVIGNELFISATETTTKTIAYLKDVTGGKILGNTFRQGGGNPATYPALGIEVVREDEIANIFDLIIDNNQFYDVSDGIKHDPTNSQVVHMGPGNIYHNMTGTRQNMNGNTQAMHRAVWGDGTLALPSGWAGTLALEKRAAAALAVNRTGSDGTVVSFHREYGTAVGSISVTASATAYVTSSDYRLKSNIRDLSSSGAFIDSLRPRRFELGGVDQAGFIAHEFAEISPLSVIGQKDEVDAEGNPVYQAIQASTSEVIANIVAELQSLRRRVAELETRLEG